MGHPKEFEMASAAKAKKGSATGWIFFLATLLVLSFAAMPGFEKYSVVADRLLVATRLSLVLALSVLAVRNWMSSNPSTYKDTNLLKRLRGWYYDEDSKNSNGG
jgi:hypothetical protein